MDDLKQKLETDQNIEPHVIFLQETHIGPNDEIEIKGWKSFYTKEDPKKKGAAILIKDDLEFEKLNVVEDKNGCYVILHCKLQQQEFTLASVYNHYDNKNTVSLLSDHLKSLKSTGMLVIGGDFNTTFTKNDRAELKGEDLQKKEPNQSHKAMRKDLDKLIEDFQLLDVFNTLNGDSFNVSRFTYTQTRDSEILHSRLDYFFMPKERIFVVSKCEVIPDVSKRDHKPLLLQLILTALSEQEIREEETRNALEDLKL